MGSVTPLFPKASTPFLKDIEEDGYHIFSRKYAKIPGYYLSEFPEYPGAKISDLSVGDQITIRAFFNIGAGKSKRIDGGYIDLEIEHIEDDHVMALIVTQLPSHFPLQTGSTIELFEDEILCISTLSTH